MSRLLGRTKQQTSVAVKALLVENRSSLLEKLTIRERPGFDRNLHSAPAIENSINYIHANPVKRELCRREVDWQWSSAKYYADGVQDAWFPSITKPDPAWFHRSGA